MKKIMVFVLALFIPFLISCNEEKSLFYIETVVETDSYKVNVNSKLYMQEQETKEALIRSMNTSILSISVTKGYEVEYQYPNRYYDYKQTFKGILNDGKLEIAKLDREFEVRTTGEYKLVVIANFLYQGVEYKIEDQKIINIISPDKYGLDGCYRGTVIYTSKKDSKDNLDCVHFNLKSYGEEGYYKETSYKDCVFDNESKEFLKDYKILNIYKYENKFNAFYFLKTNKGLLYLSSSVKNEKITPDRILKLDHCEELKTNLPEKMPEDFSFKITDEFDFYYDSKLKELDDGYNYELDMRCKATLELSTEKLKEIYNLLRLVKVDQIPPILVCGNSYGTEPSYNLHLTVNCEGVTYNITITGIITYNEWKEHRDLGMVYEQILNSYIYNTREYKLMPKGNAVYE